MPLKTADLPPVGRTMLITLTHRALESRKPGPLIYDPWAAAIVSQFDAAITAPAGKFGLEQTIVMLRARTIDGFAQRFLAQAPGATVVDLGCGLDTRFYRLDNGELHYFALDLPEVIALRERFLPRPDPARFTHIPSSVFAHGWMDQLAAAPAPILFIAEGVQTYLSRSDLAWLLGALAKRFPGAEFICDVISRFTAFLIRLDPMQRRAGATIGWGVDESTELERLNRGIRLVEESFYVREGHPRMGLMRPAMKFLPFGRASRVVRLRLG